MFKNYLKGIEGIADYPEVSLTAFFLFFIVLAVWVIRTDKRQLEGIARMPLESDSNDSAL